MGRYAEPVLSDIGNTKELRINWGSYHIDNRRDILYLNPNIIEDLSICHA
jgi:hypothetical protein